MPVKEQIVKSEPVKIAAPVSVKPVSAPVIAAPAKKIEAPVVHIS